MWRYMREKQWEITQPESVDGPLDVFLCEIVDGVVSRVGKGEGRQRHRERERRLLVDGAGHPPPVRSCQCDEDYG